MAATDSPLFVAWRTGLAETARQPNDPAKRPGDPAQQPDDERATVTQRLEQLVAQAQHAQPGLPLDPIRLVEHLARKRPAKMTALDYLAVVNAPDLLLAFQCGQGDAAALALFEQRHGQDLRMVYAQGRGDRPPFDEYAQMVRTKLLTGEHPRVRDYAGVGELKNWLRVAASRVLIDLQRAARTGHFFAEDAALAVPTPADDPETEYLKRLYRAEMRSAFEAAAEQLSAEDRNCLRDYYAKGLTIDQLAATRGIHRATAARRVAHARSAVLQKTRQLLMQRTRLSQDELASVVRLIESQLYVSVERVFAKRPA